LPPAKQLYEQYGHEKHQLQAVRWVIVQWPIWMRFGISTGKSRKSGLKTQGRVINCHKKYPQIPYLNADKIYPDIKPTCISLRRTEQFHNINQE
jgi:hypothetical protein